MQDLLTVRQSAVNRLGNYLISKPRAYEVKLQDGYSTSRNADRPLLELGASRADRSNQLVCGPRTETRLPSARFSIGFRIT